MADTSHQAHNPLDPNNLFGHVQDAEYFHVPRNMSEHGDGHIYLPQPLAKVDVDSHGHAKVDAHGHPVIKPIYTVHTGFAPLDNIIEPLDLKLTKFMVLEGTVAIVLCFLFIRLATKMRGGANPRGRMWNLLETFLMYFRDHVARPAIGHHDADKFLPFLWTVFFFVLGCNLFGMLPWMGSPTGSLAVTGTLALMTFGAVVGTGMAKLGPVGFWKGLVPHMDLPGALKVLLLPMIFLIEVLGLLIKHFVLSVRLLANVLAGHVVLAVLVGFIGATGAVVASHSSPLFWSVSIASVLGSVALSLLELFVAFLQAYIFTFLSALFIGAAVHPH